MSALLQERAETSPAFEVLEPEFRRLLGYPRDHFVEGRALELADWARTWFRDHGRPWWYARQAESLSLGTDRITIEGIDFTSHRLHEMLQTAGADSAMLVAVSAGTECEEMARKLWDEGKPDEYFFLEVYGSAVVEALVASAAFALCEWADGHGAAVLPHYSPGYPDWNIADQKRLLDLTMHGRHGPAIRALDSGMLQPKKSLLAVFGITPHVERVQRLTSLVPCANCSLPRCRYRRAPYHDPLPRIESVGAPSAETGDAAPAAVRPAVLTANARYSVSPRVLQKWARDRLRLTVLGDGTVQAKFRYDGSTCSNMGHPLAFEYHVRLSPRDDGYTISDARCAPAPNDAGYTMMCEYLANPDGLMDELGAEKPLLGRPLDDVVTWQRAVRPSGCYCTAEAREHKWGLALETLHYALVQELETP